MQHQLPPLPYDYAALEPHIDARTMRLHHDRHHRRYVADLNAAVSRFPALQSRSALWLLAHSRKVPPQIRTDVRNSAGGHLNHSLYWRSMTPAGTGGPSGLLADAIDRDFGSLERLKDRFMEAGSRLFGAGWVWLTASEPGCGALQVRVTSGHDNPMTQGYVPLLLHDLWEHAYYLLHEDRRAEFLNSWWRVVDWERAGRRYERDDSRVAIQRNNAAGVAL